MCQNNGVRRTFLVLYYLFCYLGLLLVKVIKIPPLTKSRFPFFVQIVARCSETNEKSIFRYLRLFLDIIVQKWVSISLTRTGPLPVCRRRSCFTGRLTWNEENKKNIIKLYCVVIVVRFIL